MKLGKGSEKNSFDIKNVTFTQITTIKKALSEYAKKGSSTAVELVKELERELNNTTI